MAEEQLSLSFRQRKLASELLYDLLNTGKMRTRIGDLRKARGKTCLVLVRKGPLSIEEVQTGEPIGNL